MKVERGRKATKCLQADSDMIFMVMDEIWALCDKTKDVATNVTSLRKQDLKMEAELRQSSKHAAAARVCDYLLKENLFAVGGELAASGVKCTNLRWGCNEMVLQMQIGEGDVTKALKAPSTL